MSKSEDIFVEKGSEINQLIDHIQDSGLFEEDRMRDVQYLEEESSLRILVINKKEERVIGRAGLRNVVEDYPQNKYRLVCSIIPDRYQSGNQGEDKVLNLTQVNSSIILFTVAM